MDCSTPGSPVLHSLPEFAHIELVMLSNQLNPFSFCLQTFPASGSFPVSQLFTSEGQNIGASASVLPMNNQGWFPLGLTYLISLCAKRLSRVFSSTTIQKHQSSALSHLYDPILTSIHDYWRNHSFDYTDLSSKWCLCFYTLSRFAIAFPPRSKRLNFMAAVTVHSDFGTQENTICHCFHFPPYIYMKEHPNLRLECSYYKKQVMDSWNSWWNYCMENALCILYNLNSFPHSWMVRNPWTFLEKSDKVSFVLPIMQFIYYLGSFEGENV